MLTKYEDNPRHDKYYEFYNEKIKEIISPSNEYFTEIIRDMALDYMRGGTFDSAILIDDIRSINCCISETIAQYAIDEGVVAHNCCNDDDFDQFIVEVADEIIDVLFFGEDLITAMQEMIFITSKKYNLPITIRRDMFFDYPEILSMCSEKGHLIELLPDEDCDIIDININHAQLTMFDDLFDNEPCYYGNKNILLYIDDGKGKDNTTNLLEG